MFVMTAKLNKKKITAILLALVLIIAVVAVAVSAIGGKQGGKIRDSNDAAAYLESLGWQVSPQPLEVQDIVIPRRFNGVYETYIELQRRQGLSSPLQWMAAARSCASVCLPEPSGPEIR